MNIDQLIQLASLVNNDPKLPPSVSSVARTMFAPGANVLIRTVTHIQTGIVVDCDEQFVRLSSAAWIADTGRFHDALKSGLTTGGEVEPFVADCIVSLGAIIDATTIPSVPTKQR